MKIAAIASGSNGNCYYIEQGDSAVLVDAGISAGEIFERMSRLGLSMSKLRGVFISHEHADHIRGIDVLSRKYGVAVFMTEKTYASYGNIIEDTRLNFFSPGQTVICGEISVHPFLKSHDAAEPCSFSISGGERNVLVLTDIGLACENVILHLKHTDAVFLESNYDDDMLQSGDYTAHLKKRIASDVGHLSNTQAARLIVEHASSKLKHVFLSHLSGNNNTPELALSTFCHFMTQRKDLTPEVILTSREKEGALVCLD
ncbi:MAG: MBL fold metallo-hydrolase [Smithellaceae bacterium]